MIRRRRSALLLACTVAACAGAPTPSGGGGFGTGGGSFLAAPATEPVRSPERPAAAPAPAIAEVHSHPAPEEATAPRSARDEERALREQLARRSDPTEPALDLAGFLCSRERHAEALVVIDTARARSTDPRLRVARAGLLRDLGDRRLAAGELRNLARERGADDLHPSLLLEWAELEWIEGDTVAASAALDQLSRGHGTEAWCNEQRAAIDAVQRGVATGKAPSALGPRDLLGNLRGSSDLTVRRAAFERLMAFAGADANGADLAAQAVTVALGDSAPAVRARAVALVPAGVVDGPAFLNAALADEAPEVRRAAAVRANDLAGTEAVDALLERIAIEDDPGAFFTLHRSLDAIVGGGPNLTEGAATSGATRTAVRTAWRQRCSR